jgi:hypothetical protein
MYANKVPESVETLAVATNENSVVDVKLSSLIQKENLNSKDNNDLHHLTERFTENMRFEHNKHGTPKSLQQIVVQQNFDKSKKVNILGHTEKNKNTYDTSTKNRVPSWTDRILYRSNCRDLDKKRLSRGIFDRSGVITAVKYDSCMDITWSDHKPVYGEYSIGFQCKNNLFSNI